MAFHLRSLGLNAQSILVVPEQLQASFNIFGAGAEVSSPTLTVQEDHRKSLLDQPMPSPLSYEGAQLLQRVGFRSRLAF